MDGLRQWERLSDAQRRAVVVAGVVDVVAKAVALRDLRRRPAAEVRGPKWAWGAAIGLIGSAGAVPAAYLLAGRRR